MTSNDLEPANILAHVHIFASNMHTLSHIRTALDNTVAQRWAERGSFRLATEVGTILQYLALMTRTHQIYYSVRRIAGANNKMDNSNSRLTYLTNRMFLQPFEPTFPQKAAAHPSVRVHVAADFHAEQQGFLQGLPQPYPKNTPPPGANGASSENFWEYQMPSKVSGILSLFSRSSQSACKLNFWNPAGYLSRISMCNSTFVPSGIH